MKEVHAMEMTTYRPDGFCSDMFDRINRVLGLDPLATARDASTVETSDWTERAGDCRESFRPGASADDRASGTAP